MRWKLKDELRDELRRPIGEALSLTDIEKLNSGEVIVVGDIATLTFYEKNIIPRLSVVDFHTKRQEVKDLRSRLKTCKMRVVKVRNPASVITEDLYNSIKEALGGGQPVRIEVEGEEDLAALICILLAPRGAKVVYGLPGEGLILVEVDKEKKKMVENVLHQMEVEQGENHF